MGVVWEALDRELNRLVAIKLMRPELLVVPELAARFRREARAAAALRHPNVVTIHDFGAVEGQHAYLVMELLEGTTLRDEMRTSGPLSPDHTREILSRVGAALGAAHHLNLIHRDVKPENIFLARVGDAQVPKILDFGVVKSLAPPGDAAATEATTPGQFVGTLRYMSPEQWRGKPPSPAWDLWALSVVAYEMLTGAHPFPTVTAHREMLMGKTSFKPVEAGPGSGDWNRFFTGAFSADATQRPASAREFLASLSGSAPTAGVAPTRPRIALRWRPSRRVLAAAFVLLCAVAALALWFRDGARQIDSLAILPFANDSGDSAMDYLSDGMTDDLIHTVSQVPGLSVTSRNSVFQFKPRDVSPQTVSRALGVRAVLTGRMLRRGDQLLVSVELADGRTGRHLWGQRYDRKLADIFQMQDDISRRIAETLRLTAGGAGKSRTVRRSAADLEAHGLYLKGRYHWNKRTPDGLNKGIEYFKQAIEKDPTYALAYAGLADCYALQPGLVAPGDIFPMARAAATKALELDDSLAEPHATLAFIRFLFDWDWGGAELECRRAIELNPNYAMAHSVYGRYLAAMGRFEEALQEVARAQQLDPLSLAIRSAFAVTYYHAREYDEAARKYTATLSMDPRFGQAQAGLARVLIVTRRLPEALAPLQAVLKADQTETGALAEIGRVYGMTGQTSQALGTVEMLKKISRDRYVSPYFVAIPYVGLGDKDRAYEWLEKAYQDRSWPMVFLKVEPTFDPLRSDDRFQGLLKRIGLAR